MMIRFHRKWYVYYGLTICMLSVVNYSCFDRRERTETGERIYASVNDTPLTESELRAIVPMEFYNKLTPAHKREIVKEWVNNELLYQEALRLGIDKEPEIARILEKSKRDLLTTELLERKLAVVKIPSEEELKQYYEKNGEYFKLQSDEYRVRYALFDNMKDAQSFWQKVKNGASFSELAREESIDPSAESGGSLGIVNEESVEPDIFEAIVNTIGTLGLRKISYRFSVIDGFGLVIVDEIFEKGTLKPLKDAREQVLDFYMIEKREEAKKSILMKLASETKVEYNF